MAKQATVEEFLADLEPEKRELVNKVRALILEAEPSLTETMKWNAPNYVYKGKDRITFNLVNKEDAVNLILHMGTSTKEDKKAQPVMKNDEGLVTWNSDIRGVITTDNLMDNPAETEKLSRIIKAWLALG